MNHMPPNHQAVTERFVAACRADERVLAAFLGGSYAAGNADAYSDLDLFLITTDETYEAFCSERETFVRHLGEPLFLEDFGASDGLLFILADDTEGELWIGRESRFQHIYGGAHRVLLDKTGILEGVVLPEHKADPVEQVKTLRQQVEWFWHDMAHFIKAMGRGQLWFAYGELEILRQVCVNLARLRVNFKDAQVGDEPYFKVDQALPVEQLSPLQVTYCPMEYEAMLQAAYVILRFYREAAASLAQAHAVPYPDELDRFLVARLDQLHAQTAEEQDG
jgi:predicted nucleotidyltransferase